MHFWGKPVGQETTSTRLDVFAEALVLVSSFWSSQDSVETPSSCFVSRFTLLGAHAIQVTRDRSRHDPHDPDARSSLMQSAFVVAFEIGIRMANAKLGLAQE